MLENNFQKYIMQLRNTKRTKDNIKKEKQSEKEIISVIFSDLISFFIQTIMFLSCCFLLFPGFVNEKKALSYILGLINEYSVPELLISIYAITFIVVLLKFTEHIINSRYLKPIINRFVNEYPSILYLLSAKFLAGSVFLSYGLYSKHIVDRSHTPKEMLCFGIFISAILVIYGLIVRYFLVKEKR